MGQALIHAREALRIATAIQHPQWIAVCTYGLGDTYLHLLQPALARAALESGVERARSLGSAFVMGILTSVMPPEQLPHTLAERQVAWVWGELALAQGEPKRALLPGSL